MSESIISVGIDIGTTTTQVIFSKLKIEDMSSYFTAPNISITDKELIYRGKIYFTPLLTQELIDAKGIRDIVEQEYRNAKIKKDEVSTGAVIITGESARKENARAVLEQLSSFAGEFVVSTAGPDLESEIAGKGSGASAYAKKSQSRVINLDVGGGTTNIAIYDCGKVVARTCVDIGGRLIRGELDKITYINPKIKKLIKNRNLSIEEGKSVEREDIHALTVRMSEILMEAIGKREKSEDAKFFLTEGSSPLFDGEEFDAITFSGGVADLIGESDKMFTYGDIGDALGNAIYEDPDFDEKLWFHPRETIQATVIGAGMYTMDISGSTITYTKDIFPLKNVPVYFLEDEEVKQLIKGSVKTIAHSIQRFTKQRDNEQFVIAFEGQQSPTYAFLKQLAEGLKELYDMLAYEIPVLLIVDTDCAKILGLLLDDCFSYKRDIICIDQIQVKAGDYVDFGRPLMSGAVIPVVVKTLLFG